MEEFNKSKNTQDPVFTEPNDQKQGQSGNSSEITYWESQQNIEQPVQYSKQSEQFSDQQNQAPLQENPEGADVASTEVPKPFYAYYQQQACGENSTEQNDEQPVNNQPGYHQRDCMQTGYQTGSYFQKTKRSLHRKVLAVMVALLVIFTGTATAYANRNALINTYASITKTPLEYYAFVEKNNLSQAAEGIRPYLSRAEQNTAYNVKSDVTINRETIDSLLQSSAGMSLSDLESELGIPFKSFGFNMYYGKKDNIINETFGVELNQIGLISLEMFMDTAASDIFMRCPELSKAYVKITKEDISSDVDFSQIKTPTSDQTINFLKRYSDIVINNISNLTTEKNYKLKLDTISTKCSKLTVTITNDDVYRMCRAILKEAKNDDYILNLLPMYSITKEEYQSTIDESLTELNASSDDLLSDDIKMIVYVDSNSKIIGREFTADSSKAVFSYKLLNKDHYDEYNMHIKDEDGNKVFDVTGNQREKDGAYDGKATIKITDPSGMIFSNLSLDAEYEDFRMEQKDGRSYQYGTVTISSPELMGIQIISESTVKDDIQKNKIAFKMGVSSLATIKTTMQYLTDYQVAMPPKDVEAYNSSQLDSYYSTIDFEKFVKEFSAKFGVDLQAILDRFGYNY